MRHAVLCAVALVPFLAGCSAYIAGAGKDLSALADREQVQAQFGTPDATGTQENRAYEEFHTRLKIAETKRSQTLAAGSWFARALPETILFPLELYRFGKRSAFGQDVRFCYDSLGRVCVVYLDGKKMHFSDQPSLGAEVATPKSIQPVSAQKTP